MRIISLTVFLILFASTWLVETAYIGCYPELASDRMAPVNPGLYEAQLLTNDLCQNMCWQLNYKYATTTQGKACLCGDVYGIHGDNSTINCTEPCPHDANQTCGGASHSEVYSILALQGLNFFPQDLYEVLAPGTFELNVTTGDGVVFWGDFSDYAGPTAKSSETTITYNPRHIGRYAAEIHAQDSSLNQQTDTGHWEVQARIRDMTFGCTQSSRIDDYIECKIHVTRGSHFNVTIDFDDGAVVSTPTADSMIETVGGILGRTATSVDIQSGAIVISLSHVFTHDGLLLGLEYDAISLGPISFQIYRPYCDTGTSFCYQSYSCLNDTTDNCTTQPDIWLHSCDTGTKYSFAKRLCVDEATGDVVQTAVLKDWPAGHQVDGFDWVSDIAPGVPYSATRLGVNVMHLTELDILSITHGDVLGISTIDRFRMLNISGANPIFLEEPVDGFHTRSVSSGYRVTTLNQTAEAVPAVNAFISRPREIVIEHLYTTGEVIFDIGLIIENGLSIESAEDHIDVQSVIVDLDFITLTYGLRDVPLNFTVAPHVGNNPIYRWNFDDGTEMVELVNSSIEHTFNVTGYYTIILYASNDVSSDTISKRVQIIVGVSELNITADASASVLGTNTTLLWTMFEGTNATFTVDMGDGTKYTFPFHEEGTRIDNGWTNETLGGLTHIYADIGNYSVTINASNVASWMTATTYIPVQIPIVGLQIDPVAALLFGEDRNITFSIREGSHVQLQALFGGVPTTRVLVMDAESKTGYAFIGSEDYSDIGLYRFKVEASNLVTPTITKLMEVWVDLAIRNLTISIDRPFVDAGAEVTFDIDMLACTRLVIDPDFGDSSLYTNIEREKLPEDETITIVHAFNRPGTYNVTIHLKNFVSEEIRVYQIVVQYPVQNFDSSISNLIPMLPGETGDAALVIGFLGGVQAATDARYTVTWGDNTNVTNDITFTGDSPNSLTTIHPYLDYGTYDVTLNISNLVNYTFFSFTIDVEQPITNLALTPNPQYVPSGQSVALPAYMPWGSRVQCRWIFGDGTISTAYQAMLANDTTTVDHVYANVGSYKARLQCFNSLGTTRVGPVLGNIVVQIPVLGFHVDCMAFNHESVIESATVRVRFSFYMSITAKFPTDAAYTIDYANGDTTAEASFPNLITTNNIIPGYHLLFSFSNEYALGGNYTVLVRVKNLVSDVTFSVHHDVYEGIKNLHIGAYISEGIGRLDGGGPNKDYFPIEKYVLIVAEKERGSHVTYTWSFGDGEPDVSVYVIDEQMHSYPDVSSYTISVHAANRMSAADATITIHTQRSVAEIAISCLQPKPQNSTFDFQLDFGIIGTDACYFVDFKDDLLDNRYVLLGDNAECMEKFPDEMANPRTRFDVLTILELETLKSTAPDYTANQSLSDVYRTTGAHMVTLIGVNKVSRVTYIWETGVTIGVCSYPYLNVSAPNTCIPPMCDDLLPGVPKRAKADRIVLLSDYIPDCESTSIKEFTWTVYTVNEETLKETRFRDLEGTDTHKRTLTIPSRVLPYGLYRCYLSVSMVEAIPLTATDSTLLRIIPSPLTVGILGGMLVVRRYGDNITVDGNTNTGDPDINFKDKTGITYYWMCRRLCETFPTYSYDFKEMLTPMTTNCTYDIKHLDDRGCSMLDGYDTAGLVPNAVTAYVQMSTIEMYQEEMIELRLIAQKGDRRGEATQAIYVGVGDPPIISIKCVTNCGQRMNPVARFSLESSIDGWQRDIKFEWEWSLTGVPADGNRYNNAPVDPELWVSSASTGLISPNMAIDGGVFSRRVSRLFQLNDEPIVGKCAVTPTTGKALTTLFVTSCSEAFKDEDLPITYLVGYKISTTDVITWIADALVLSSFSNAPSISFQTPPTPRSCWNRSNSELPDYQFPESYTVGVGSPFPPGLAERDYMIDVVVRGTDYVGSFSDIWQQIQVTPNGLVTETELAISSLSEDGEVDTLLSAGESRSIQLLNAAFYVLNEDANNDIQSSGDAANSTTTDADLSARVENRKAIRSAKLLALRNANMDLDSMCAINEMAAAVNAVTKVKEEVDSDALSEGEILIEQMVNSQGRAGDATSVNALEEGTTNLGAGIGNIVKANVQIVKSATGKLATSTSTAEEIDEAKSAKTKAKENFGRYKNLTDNLSVQVFNKKVGGEKSSSLRSDSLSIDLVKMCTDKINESPILKSAEGSSVLLPDAEVAFGDSNSSDFFIMAQILRFPESPYAWADGNSNLTNSVGGDVISIGFLNTSGSPVELSDVQQEFDIFINRKQAVNKVEVIRNATTGPDDNMLLHIIDVNEMYSCHIRMDVALEVGNTTDNGTDPVTTLTDPVTNGTDNATTTDTGFILYFREGSAPTEASHDFNCTLPLSDEKVAEMMSYLDGNDVKNLTAKQKSLRSSFVLEEPDRWTCFLPAQPEGTGLIQYYIGVRERSLNVNATIEASSDGADSSTSETAAEYVPVTYDMSIYSTMCAYWDDDNDAWATTGVRVGPLTTADRAHCLAKHMSSFTSGFVVPMNSIDLNNSGFTKLDQNPVIFATMISVMCFYGVMLIWARKRDKQDIVKAGATPLPDNDPRDKYLYELRIATGSRTNAGTSARVSLIFTGDHDETPPRVLIDDKRPVLQRSALDTFIMAVPRSLGTLSHLRVWHDNTGDDPSWYFSRCLVTDIQTGTKFYFIVNRWLAVEEDDGQIDRVIPIAGKKELTSFQHLFWTKTKKSFSDSHMWFSVVNRPAKSNFTRVQRLTCCLSLLFTSMMASLAWYRAADSASSQMFKVGPFSFTLAGLYVGVLSSLMAFPPGLIITLLFRYSRPNPRKQLRKVHISFSPLQESEPTPELQQPKPGSTRNKDNLDVPLLAPSAPSLEYDGTNRSASPYALQRPMSTLSLSVHMQNLENQSIDAYQTNTTSQYVEPKKARIAPATSIEIPQPGQRCKPPPKAKKQFMLPFFFKYVAYMLAFASVAVSFWLAVEFGGVFGRTKSEEWFLSFIISVFESIFLSQPLKVILVAVFFALVLKKPEKDEDNENPDLKEDEEWLHKHLSERDMQDSDNMAYLQGWKDTIPLPLNNEYLRNAREQRMKEVHMWAIVREILLYVVFLYLLMMVGYGNRDVWSYRMRDNFNNMLGRTKYIRGPGLKKLTFYTVTSREESFQWLEGILLPALFTREWYSPRYRPERLIDDKQNIMVGTLRLRQIRVRPELCMENVRHVTNLCTKGYSSSNEDDQNYALGWKDVNMSDPALNQHPSFEYRRSNDLGGHPYWGIFATYPGGGYLADLGRTMEEATKNLAELKTNQWLDKNTRALFVEFVVYNQNVNLWGICLQLIEFLPAGGAFPYFGFHVMRLDRYWGTFMFVVMGSELITVIFVIIFTVREIKKIMKHRKEYFKDLWNVMELLVLAMCFSAIVILIYRIVHANWTETKYRNGEDAFNSFTFAVIWDNIYAYLMGFIVCLATVKFLRLLRFNKKISFLTSTIQYAGKPLLHFSPALIIIVIAFACLAYLIFGKFNPQYSTFIKTLGTLLQMILTVFDKEKYENRNLLWGSIFFSFFSLFTTYLMVNLMVVILLDAFKEVRIDLAKQMNDYEIVDFMMGRFKTWVGIGLSAVSRQPNRRTRPGRVKQARPKYVYIEGPTEQDELLDELDDKLDRMVDILERILETNIRDEIKAQEEKQKEERAERKIYVQN